MYEHSLGRLGPSELPAWLTLDGLIQILAVDNAGPASDPTEFAPLMASIIRKQVAPALSTYTSEDLAILVDIEERAKELPPETVKSLAADLARARYSGRLPSDPEVQLAIKRAFQGGRLKEADRAEQLSSAKNVVETELSLERRRSGALGNEVVTLRAENIRRAAKSRLTRQIALAVTIPILVVLIGALAAETVDPERSTSFWEIFIGFLIVAGGPLVWLRMKAFPAYRAAMDSAERVARVDVENWQINDDD